MGKKTAQEIEQIRDQRENGESIANLALRYDVSTTYVSGLCKDIKVNIKTNYREKLQIKPIVSNPVITLRFENLSPEDQKKYSECKPYPKKDPGSHTYAGF
jgi:hypothetical protein